MTRNRFFFLDVGWQALLKDFGLRPEHVLRRAGLPEDLLSRGTRGVSTEDYFRDYAAQAQPMAQSMIGEASRKRQSPPELIADTIAEAVTARRPRTRYAVGFGAKPMIFMRGLLPDRTFDGLMHLATGISGKRGLQVNPEPPLASPRRPPRHL